MNSNRYERVKKAMLCMTRQCWEQGLVAQTLLETGDMEVLKLVVHDIVLRQSQDGRLCNIENTPAVTDSSFCINATMAVGKELGVKAYILAARRNIDYLLNKARRSRDGVLYHMAGTKEIWADSAAFLPFTFTLEGHYNEAIEQMEGLQRKLYDPQYRLYYHIWDEEMMAFKKKIFWGVGNGWFLTGMLRMYEVLPDEYNEKKQNIKQSFLELLDTMLSLETENYLFRDNMNDEASFEETEVSEMISYCIYRGVHIGLLSKRYIERANRIRKAILKKVTDSGLIKDCAGSPHFCTRGTSVEGQAHFLMMEQAYSQLS